MSTHPEVLWAQRSSATTPEKNDVYLTVNLPDINQSTLEYTLTSTSVSFKADTTTSGAHYAFDLELFAEVDTENSTWRINSRHLSVVLRKKALKHEYWPRLTKETTRPRFIKTDFSKWVDEEEQDDSEKVNLDDDPVGGFPGMGDSMPDFEQLMRQSGAGAGAGDFPTGGGADVDDSDEDEDGPPALEDEAGSK